MTLSFAALHWTQLILPFVIIGAVAMGLPLMVARHMPETYAALVLNLCISATICFAMVMGYFSFEYMRLGVGLGAILTHAGLTHIATISMISMVFWGPLIVLMVLTRVQGWRPQL